MILACQLTDVGIEYVTMSVWVKSEGVWFFQCISMSTLKKMTPKWSSDDELLA